MTIDDESAETSEFLDSLLTKATLAQVQLDRTNKGTNCMDCEKPIPEERVALMPGICRCVSCQSEVDKQRSRKTIFSSNVPAEEPDDE